ISFALGGQRNIGPWGGGHPFDVQVRRIPAGAAVCPFHSHLVQWELFVVHAGQGTVRAGNATHRVKAGDVFLHPPNEPHKLTNSGTTELEVVIIADNPPLDAFYYPDSDKWGLRPPNRFFRLTEVDYFEGEDAVADPNPAGRTSIAAAAASPTPLYRQLNLDDVAWQSWASPKGKFRGTSKELSIALGANHNTPTGLGAHPFDLELSRLAPGECGCPFHSHSAQWELFWILAGEATVRVSDQRHPLVAGDIVLHPPGETHAITNTGSSELLFYLVADNPPHDNWHYPDSDKWGQRWPRKIFRATDAEYWDGEE
ncbi:MAG TPA: cupin domain-containing protein, partial [Opitutaceae bacterium]|nr:cupin domain-containing protein [Opitutaceae bacterium]